MDESRGPSMAAPHANSILEGVAELRSALGLSQQALADLVELSRPTISKIEEGREVRKSTIDYFYRLINDEFAEKFEILLLKNIGANTYLIEFKQKEQQQKTLENANISWKKDLDALSGHMMDVCSRKNTYNMKAFHDDLVSRLKCYVDLSGYDIVLRKGV